jgi:MFS transporter, DHA1 family, multidrug resistance protein
MSAPFHILLALFAMTAIGSVALNLFLPSMPGLVGTFADSQAEAQATLTAYLVGWGIGQFVCGALSDRWGRRRVLFAGMAICAAGSLLCASASGLSLLVCGRFLQATGASAGLVLSAAIVQDLYDRAAATRMLAWISAMMAGTPAAAAALGGVLESHGAGRLGFIVLAAVAVLLLLGFRRVLPETRSRCDDRHDWREAWRGVQTLLRNRIYVGYALNFVMTNAAYYAFLAGSAFIAIDFIGVSPAAYGVMFASIPVGYFLGSAAAARLADLLSTEQAVAAGTAIAFGGAIGLAAWAASGASDPFMLFGGMAVVAIGNGLSHPAAVAGAVGADPRYAGTAAGLKGLAQMLGGAAATALVGAIAALTPLAMIIVAATALLLAIGGYLIVLFGQPAAALARPRALV